MEINKHLKEIHIFTDLSDVSQVSDWDLESMCTDYKETDAILYRNADVSILKSTQIYLLVDAFFFNFKGILVYITNNNDYEIWVEGCSSTFSYKANGKRYVRQFGDEYDIISRYQKPIDEKKLDELAEKYCIYEFAMAHDESTESAIAYKAYQIGYRKAMKK